MTREEFNELLKTNETLYNFWTKLKNDCKEQVLIPTSVKTAENFNPDLSAAYFRSKNDFFSVLRLAWENGISRIEVDISESGYVYYYTIDYGTGSAKDAYGWPEFTNSFLEYKKEFEDFKILSMKNFLKEGDFSSVDLDYLKTYLVNDIFHTSEAIVLIDREQKTIRLACEFDIFNLKELNKLKTRLDLKSMRIENHGYKKTHIVLELK